MGWWVIPIPGQEERADPASPNGRRARGAPLGPDDARAFVRDAYDALQRDVYSFAVYAARDPDVAADVTQDAFLRLLAEAERRGPPESVRAWLLRVASNLIISRGRRATVASRWLQRVGKGTDVAESPEADLLRREERARVQAMLQSLSPEARACLLMAAEGFSGREIAASIGRTELATRVLMSRARKHLRTVASEGAGAGRENGFPGR